MSSKREAKVVKLGSSYAVFLPQDWCRGNGVEKGSIVPIEYDGDVVVKPPRAQAGSE